LKSPGDVFAVTPVDMLAVEVTNIQTKVWEHHDGRGVSHERGGL